MGHYGSVLEKQRANKRLEEAYDIQGKLYDVPLSSLTFGELRFLLNLYEISHRYSWNVSPDQLERLRRIAQKVGAA